MYNFSFYLPSQNSSDLKKTLISFQIHHKTPYTTNSVILKSDEIVKYIFDLNRLSNILAKSDPFLKNEIKIVHFSETLKKTICVIIQCFLLKCEELGPRYSEHESIFV